MNFRILYNRSRLASMNRVTVASLILGVASLSFGQSNVVKSLQGDYDKLSAAFAKNDVSVMDG